MPAWLTALPIVGKFLENVFGVIDEVVVDRDQANALKANIQLRVMEIAEVEIKEASKIILAEAHGSWIQRTWRPLLMLMIIAIVANNYILVPYIGMWTEKAKILDLPGGLWALLNVGVGGYVLGRSGEKVAKTLKE
jgi:hypothetical protein